MFERLAEFLYRRNWDDPIYSFNLVCMAASVLILLILGAVSLAAMFGGHYSIPIEVFIGSIISCILFGPGIIVSVIDTVITFMVRYITRGDIEVDHYLSSKLVGEYNDKPVTLDATLSLVVVTPSIISALLFIFPMLWILVALILVIYIMMRVARMMYTVKKKLNTHVTDPDAHSKKG